MVMTKQDKCSYKDIPDRVNDNDTLDRDKYKGLLDNANDNAKGKTATITTTKTKTRHFRQR